MNRYRSQRGGVISGVLITLAVLLGLVVAAAVVGGLYLARHVRVAEFGLPGGRSVEVSTPMGSLRVREGGRLDPVKAGIPVYPGAAAEEWDSQSVSLELNFGSEQKEVTFTGAYYSTKDAADKVMEFYRKELPDWKVKVVDLHKTGLPRWIEAGRHRREVHMEYSGRGYKRFITVTEKHGRTGILLAQIGEPPAI
jgi:hypothetical protein